MARGRQQLAQGVQHHPLAALHAQRGELDGEHVAEAVGDQPGQPVALGVDEAVAGPCAGRAGP